MDKIVTRIREEADGTGTRETTARIRVLADAGVKQFAVLEFTYTASNQQLDIAYVRVVKPDGAIVNTPDYNVQDLPADVTREAPMYSDIHQKHVAVKGLGVGDTLEYKTTLRTLKPEVPGQFWFEYSFEKNNIILDEELDLDVPKDKPVTVASADAQPAITTDNGRKLYHWVSRNLSRPDPDAPPKSVKKWKPSVQVTTFSNWQEVGAWYKSLQKDQLTITPAIQAKADALTKGLTTDDEKIHAIFDAVALHVHYVGLEFGIGRYQPHPADDVLSNEYGDCKDKHTLLATLLKAEGIEAWPVLISSSRELDPATPSPGQFDHVITVVPRGDKLLWMDSTEEVAPVGAIAATLRDKQALAIPRDKPARLEQTPTELPFPQTVQFDVTGKLDEKGQFTGRFAQTYRGDVGILMRTLFRAVPEARWKEFTQRMSAAAGFGGEVTTAPEVSPVEEIEDPFHFSYSYTRDKYGEWDDRRIGPPFPPVGWELIPGVKQIKPADDIDIGSPGVQVYTAKVALPPGWHLFPPQGIDLVEDWAEYHSNYNFVDGTFTAERRLVFKKEKVPLEDWDKYLRFREAIYGDSSRMAMLNGPSLLPLGNHPLNSGSVSVATPAAALSAFENQMVQLEPLRDAFALLSTSPGPSAADLASASKKCSDAAAGFESQSQRKDPTDIQTLNWAGVLGAGWTCAGWAELENHNLNSAETYLRSAWLLTQNPLAGYQLGRVLEAKGEKAAAAHTYELAFISSPGGLMNWITRSADVPDQIAASYKRLTGRQLAATPLHNGEYKGSLRSELDKTIEIHGFVASTKISGQGYFAVAYSADGAVHASLLSGDPGMGVFTRDLQGHRFPVSLPAGSKARLVREVHLICSPYGGCDAYMLLPSAVTLPANRLKVIPVKPRSEPAVVQSQQLVKRPPGE